MEIWKKIDGFESYSVSNMGRVRNDVTVRVLSFWDNHNGYKMVTLTRNYEKHSFRVHRLVAKSFIPNPDNLPQVNHINEIKTDNRVDNLEWCTAQYNINYGDRTGRMIVTKRETAPNRKRCMVDGTVFDSIHSAERHFGFCKGSLNKRLSEGRHKFKGHTIAYC